MLHVAVLLREDVMPTKFGTTGNDTLIGSQNQDTLAGLEGDDTLLGGNGQDRLYGGDGDDSLDGGQGEDKLFGGAGDDSLNGGQGQDKLYGGAGNDVIDSGDTADNKGVDRVYGGEGDDTLISSGNQDKLYGGSQSDGFVIISDGSNFNNLFVYGGEDGDGADQDVLDLRQLKADYPDLEVIYEKGGPGDEDGRILLKTAPGGRELGRIRYTGIEKVVICFTPGTAIATPKGEVPVQDLQPGDRVLTRDNGIQELVWVGGRELTQLDLRRTPGLQPVLIRAGSLGPNVPERDVLVSPNHRMLVTEPRAALYFEDSEVLAAAKHLTSLDGIDQVQMDTVRYVHLMCARHEVVLSNGAWTESFQPGDYSLRGMDQAQRAEIYDLFPELETGGAEVPGARRALKAHEAKLLLR